jgi:hypothetical protein
VKKLKKPISKPKTNKTASRRKKYFVVEDEFIYIVHDNYFKNISEKDAFFLCLEVIKEINNCTKREFDTGMPSFIGSMKIITGLTRTAQTLEKMYPKIISNVFKMPELIAS